MTDVVRRQILKTLGMLGIGSVTFQRAIAEEAAKGTGLTLQQIASAEWVAGISLTDEQRTALTKRLNSVRSDSARIRALPISYDALPAFRFDPEMADPTAAARALTQPAWLVDRAATAAEENSAVDNAVMDEPSFLSIEELGRRLRSGALTSVQLTQHCLDRLMKHDPALNCVVTLTEDLALRQAQQADEELAAGRDRGPLHGIPWGAKDLIGLHGYPTTWGAACFREQQTKSSATVVQKLEQAGAVHAAKLSLGALAMGDEWFNGQTKNPWNPQQGSSGSSAGSASAVAAGLLPFAIGSETLGSIISPTRRCGVAGLRPTFGRISRAGCMALSWTMDKLGPIARSADDCGFILAAIHGKDAADPTTVDRWFQWPVDVDFSAMKIGRVTNCETAATDQVALEILKELGATLIDIELPRDVPEWTLAGMLDVEAACIFQELVSTNISEGLNSWPEIFRASHFVSAIDYLQASRARFQLMHKMAAVFRDVQLYVGGSDLGITNLTGHPTFVLPVIMAETKPQPRPLCCTLTGGLHDEATLLAVARRIEQKACVLEFHPQL